MQTMQDGDNAVAVRTDLILDPETGLMIERKTVVAEVLSESGEHKALLVGQQTAVSAAVRFLKSSFINFLYNNFSYYTAPLI